MITRKNKSGQFRQGDVLLVRTNKKATGVKTKRCTLALGEATGHHHTIEAGAIGYADSEVSLAEMIVVEAALANLVHQEHSTIALPKGNYEVGIQCEYTPEAIKVVAD